MKKKNRKKHTGTEHEAEKKETKATRDYQEEENELPKGIPDKDMKKFLGCG